MKHFVIIGDPVNHSYSPRIHEAAMRELEIEGDFHAIKISAKDLKKWIQNEGLKNYDGIAVTAPHKENIRAFFDNESEAVHQIGAVNTLFWKENILTGTNTDSIGALKALQSVCNPQGKKVLICGAGGAARAIIFALQMAQCQITLWNRTMNNTRKLVGDFGVGYVEKQEELDPEHFDIIINATPVGLNEWKSLLPEDFWLPRHVAFDTIYVPLETKFLSDAANAGAQIVTGDLMLVYQAAEQFRIWHGKEIDPDVMARAFLE